MADFTLIKLEINHGNTAGPSWVAIGGANTEVRWAGPTLLDGTDPSTRGNIASASWPIGIRPAATAIVSYTYAYSADATGDGMYANGGACPAWSKDNYLQARWNWDNTGTFANAPVFTAYVTDGTAITRGDGSLLAGHATDTGATARSYLKGNAWGRVDASGAPAAGPSNAPVVTDGTTGSVNPTAGANWMTNFQGLQGDADYIAFPATPTATTAGTWSIEFALFCGPNLTPATYTPKLTLKYAWS